MPVLIFLAALAPSLALIRRLSPSLAVPVCAALSALVAAGGAATVLLIGHASLLPLVYLAVCAAIGLLIVSVLVPALPPLLRLAGGVLVGLVVTTWTTFLLALLLDRWWNSAVLLAGTITVWGAAFIVWNGRRRLAEGWRRLTPVEVVVLAVALLFSMWLFGRAARYDSRIDDLMVARSAWADMALHVALVRSFAWGDNLPPQYPFFAGERIHYHFGYDFLAGTLERLGLRLDLALNLPAIVAFAALLILIFELARLLSGSVHAGLIAALLVPLNSSLAFRDYLRLWSDDPLRLPERLWQQATRLHVGPYDGQAISIYMTLNPYLNQRQLVLAMAVSLLVIVLLAAPLRAHKELTLAQSAGLGALLGLSLPLNGVVYLGALAVCAALFLVFGRWRDGARFLVPAVALALPAAVLLGGATRLSWLPDYLAIPYTPLNILRYWWLNAGLLLPLVVLAAVLSSGSDRRLLAAFCAPFVLGNLVQLGADPGGINHKLFNLWLALMAVYAAVVLARVAALRLPAARWLGPAAAVLLLVPLTLSGVIDAMVIKNEVMDGPLSDQPATRWIAAETPEDAVFLTSAYLYLPPSYAGRRIYLGYPVFTSTAGYDVAPRLQFLRRMYGAAGTDVICGPLQSAGIDFIELGPEELHPDANLEVNLDFWDQKPAAYDAQTRWGRLRYFAVATLCRQSTDIGNT